MRERFLEVSKRSPQRGESPPRFLPRRGPASCRVWSRSDRGGSRFRLAGIESGATDRGPWKTRSHSSCSLRRRVAKGIVCGDATATAPPPVHGMEKEKSGWRPRAKATTEVTGRVDAFQSQTAAAVRLSFPPFQFLKWLFSLSAAKPPGSVVCLYNVMACASIVAAGFTVLRSLRDSLSAFVWHFITPLDCRIKHPAKGIPTLAAPHLAPPPSSPFAPCNPCTRLHRARSLPRFHEYSPGLRNSWLDRATVSFAYPVSPRRESKLDTPRPLPVAAAHPLPSRSASCLSSASPPLHLPPLGRLCRSMTRLVIQEGKREKGPSGRTLWNYGRWKTADLPERRGAAAIAVSNLPADIRCRVTRVANAIDQDEPVARTCRLSRCGTERNGWVPSSSGI